MKRRDALFLLGAGCLGAATPAWGNIREKPFEFGIFPYLSARALMAAHQPFKAFLESRLGRMVNLSTAPSFQAFNERTLAGDYDLVITPPHLARLAQIEAKLVPLTVYSKVLRGVLAVRKDSPVTEVRHLRGKGVVVPDSLAIVTMLGRSYLASQGLRADIDYRLLVSTSHASAAYAVAHHEADAVVSELAAFQKQIPAEVRQELRILDTLGHLPHVMFMAHRRLGAERIDVLREALVDFARNTLEGRSFIETSGFEGMRPVTEADMKAMDVYVAELRLALAGGR